MKIIESIVLTVSLALGGSQAELQSAESGPGAAQPKSSFSVPTGLRGEVKSSYADGPFDLSFAGGTTNELIEAMKKAGEKEFRNGIVVNVLIPPELKDIKVPPMQLRSVNPKAVFEALNLVWRDTFQWTRSIPPGWAAGAYSATSVDIWILSRKPDQRKTQAFYVGNLLQKFKIDDITTAVRTTWQFAGKNDKTTDPELKYHQDTQLLIALADDAQLKTALEVLSQLKLAVDPASAIGSKPDDARTKR